MMQVIVHVGQEAINAARERGLTLCRYRDKTGPAREGLTVAEAQEIAQRDSSLIYLTVVEGREE